jgi:hypothetical protein
VVLLISSASAAPTVTTDKADYFFFETVTISGGGFAPNTFYDIPVIRPDGSIIKGDGSLTAGWDKEKTDASGNFTYLYQLDAMAGIYEVRVYPSPWGGNLADSPLASVTFTDAPPQITLEQCRNGAAGTPNNCPDGGGSGWVTGNVGSSQGHFVEGYSMPYRAIMDNLPTSTSITVELGYDIKHSSRHALDFLTHYDRLEPHASFSHSAETVDPTGGVSGIAGTTTTTAIPAPSSTSPCASPVSGQPTTSFNSLPAAERLMTLFGGTITAIAYTSEGCLTDAVAETRIEVTFTVDSATAVLAWGGHIGRALDWGAGNSAGGISGSPYHMRLIDWSLGSIGQQDRSLSAGTVEPTGIVTINKVAVGDDDTFSFTATPDGIPAAFDITTSGGTGSQTYNDVTAGVRTVTESGPPAGWSFTSLTCDDPDSGTTVSGQTATIDLDPGETVECTFTNIKLPTLTLVKTVINDDGGTAVVGDFPLFIDGSPVTSGVANTVSVGAHTASETTQAGYAASSWGGDCNPDGTITLTPGQNATCTITNDDVAPTLTVTKIVVNDDGGTAVVGDFTLRVDGGIVTSGVANTVLPGVRTVSEDAFAGYTGTIGGDCDAAGLVTLANGDSKTCTITNDDIAPTLTVTKIVVNDDGGTAVVGDFTLRVDGGVVTSGVANTVSAGAHVVSEDNPGIGYTTTIGGDCDGAGNVTLALGDDKTCTITNDDVGPTLTLVKTVVNDDGGTKVVADFPLFIDGSPVTSGVANPVTVGSHTASETTQAGYAASTWGGDCNPDGTITLALGDNKTCTVTNNDVPIVLAMQVIKAVDGDDADSNFEDPETTSPSSSITYQVILDNDSAVPVTIVSLSDDIYDPVTCEDSSNLDIVGQVLAADDGDGAGPPDGGGDEAVCTFVETAPASEGATVFDTVTVELTGSATATASDTATLTTAPPPVGGIVEFGGAGGGSELSPPTESSAGSASSQVYGLLAAGIAAALLMASGVWYARRRRLG